MEHVLLNALVRRFADGKFVDTPPQFGVYGRFVPSAACYLQLCLIVFRLLDENRVSGGYHLSFGLDGTFQRAVGRVPSRTREKGDIAAQDVEQAIADAAATQEKEEQQGITAGDCESDVHG